MTARQTSRNTVPVLFDLDGVLVDNIRFEKAVTREIIQQLAASRSFSEATAERLWKETLEAHRQHDRWHDYSYHCQALDLGERWRTAHDASRDLLQQCPEVCKTLAAARNIGPLWLVSDATQWVVDFKLSVVGLDHTDFEEVFSVDRCSTHKGDTRYWEFVRSAMVSSQAHGPYYIDNREDRLRSAYRLFPSMIGICVDAEDHPVSLGFGEGKKRDTFIHATHESLPFVLKKLGEELG